MAGMVYVFLVAANRSRAQPLLPVQCGGNLIGAGRHFTSRKSVSASDIEEHVHMFNISYHTRLEPHHCGTVAAIARNLSADLRNDPGSFCLPAKNFNFIETSAQGFLAIHMLPSAHRLHSNQRMHMVGSGNIDGIYPVTLFLKKLSPVLICAYGRKLLADRIHPCRINITSRTNVDFFMRHEIAPIALTLPACSYAGMAEP